MAGAAEDREARVFRERGIGLRELAKKELGAFGGGDEAGMNAVGAEAEGFVEFCVGSGRHRLRLTFNCTKNPPSKTEGGAPAHVGHP